eukprot:372119-Pyramimonas_sp.AAC.1
MAPVCRHRRLVVIRVVFILHRTPQYCQANQRHLLVLDVCHQRHCRSWCPCCALRVVLDDNFQ